MYSLNIPQIKDFIRHVAIRQNEPVMIWGQPGVGKSEGAVQVTQEDDCILCDIRLSQYDSVDLRGFPGVNEKTSLTVWHAPSTLPFIGNDAFPDDKIILMFLDEINAAQDSVSAVAYQLINERRVGEHVLKPNVRIIAAGNREGDRGVTKRMALPLANRLTHAEAVVSVEEWCYHILSLGLPAIGAAFIQFRKQLLSTFDPSKPAKDFATPRTWVKALKYYADGLMPTEIRMAAMSGAIGEGPAAEFWGFEKVWQNMIPLSKILKDPEGVALPDEASMQYAVTVSVSGAMDLKNVGQLHKFLVRMPPEFAVLAWQLATKRDGAMFSAPEYIDFSRRYKAIF